MMKESKILNNVRLINNVSNAIMVLSVIAFVVAGIYYLVHRPYFNITQVKLSPSKGNVLNHISPASLQSTITSNLDGNFFTSDLVKLKSKLSEHPWIRNVDVVRVWPNELDITIEEHEAYAKWNDNMLLNTWGEVFQGNREELSDDIFYPQYYGPEGSENLVIQRSGEMATLLAPLNLSVKEMKLSDRYAWTVTLDNGMLLVLGRDGGADVLDPNGGQQQAVNFTENVKRFINAWPYLLERMQRREISKVDFRYTKGFAVSFAQDSNINPVSTETK